jgi:hypothetical protein
MGKQFAADWVMQRVTAPAPTVSHHGAVVRFLLLRCTPPTTRTGVTHTMYMATASWMYIHLQDKHHHCFWSQHNTQIDMQTF